MEKLTNEGITPIFQMENKPSEHLYKLMVKTIEKAQEKDDYLFTFVKVYPQSYEGGAIDFNKGEIERLQLIFEKKRFDNSLKEQLRQDRVLIIFGKLNQDKSERSFSVHRLALMPENVIEIKDQQDQKQPTIKITVE